MAVRFIGTHLNKIDSKGRASVPAPFRTEIEQATGGRKFFYRPDPVLPAIECFTAETWDVVDRELEVLAFGSAERELKEYEWYGTSASIEYDSEGRIVLPRSMVQKLGLKDEVRFVGGGARFKIWDPDRLDEYHSSLKMGGAIRPVAPADPA